MSLATLEEQANSIFEKALLGIRDHQAINWPALSDRIGQSLRLEKSKITEYS